MWAPLSPAFLPSIHQIWHDMYGVKANNVKSFPEAPVLSSPPPPPLEVIMKLPYEVKSDVLCAQKEFDETCKGYTLDVVDFRDFGKNSCKVLCGGGRVSPDVLVVENLSFGVFFKYAIGFGLLGAFY